MFYWVCQEARSARYFTFYMTFSYHAWTEVLSTLKQINRTYRKYRLHEIVIQDAMATLTVLNLGINEVSTPQANINLCIGSHQYVSNSEVGVTRVAVNIK